MIKFILGCMIALSSIAIVKAEPHKQAMVQKIENYFDGLKTYQADLTQLNPDQSVAKGKFFLHRPEKFRVQYSEPKELIVVSDGSFFIEYDPKEDIPNFISLESTPASLLLKKKLRLSGDVSVRDIRAENGKIYADLYKTKDPDVGHITLVFQENPMKLIRWVVQDAQGNITEVSLNNVAENQPIKDNLFETSRIKR
jgi:outer membrane lipoprotein-sorting protein